MLQHGSAVELQRAPTQEGCQVWAVCVCSGPCYEAGGDLSASQQPSFAKGRAHLCAAAKEFCSEQRWPAQLAALLHQRITQSISAAWEEITPGVKPRLPQRSLLALLPWAGEKTRTA